jgi:hypothetical protein
VADAVVLEEVFDGGVYHAAGARGNGAEALFDLHSEYWSFDAHKGGDSHGFWLGFSTNAPAM